MHVAHGRRVGSKPFVHVGHGSRVGSERFVHVLGMMVAGLPVVVNVDSEEGGPQGSEPELPPRKEVPKVPVGVFQLVV